MRQAWKINQEDITVPCPCGHYAIVRFAIPEATGMLALIATCENCHRLGDNPTTLGYMKIERSAWLELVSDPNMIVAKRQS